MIMGKRDSGAYGFNCADLEFGFEISWVVDFYYDGSRLRYPRTFRRITDEAGAKRFCKKHNLKITIKKWVTRDKVEFIQKGECIMWETKRIIELVEAVTRREKGLSYESIADLRYIKEYAKAIESGGGEWTAERLGR
jgi:hypothetical protein